MGRTEGRNSLAHTLQSQLAARHAALARQAVASAAKAGHAGASQPPSATQSATPPVVSATICLTGSPPQSRRQSAEKTPGREGPHPSSDSAKATSIAEGEVPASSSKQHHHERERKVSISDPLETVRETSTPQPNRNESVRPTQSLPYPSPLHTGLMTAYPAAAASMMSNDDFNRWREKTEYQFELRLWQMIAEHITSISTPLIYICSTSVIMHYGNAPEYFLYDCLAEYNRSAYWESVILAVLVFVISVTLAVRDVLMMRRKGYHRYLFAVGTREVVELFSTAVATLTGVAILFTSCFFVKHDGLFFLGEADCKEEF